LLAWIARDTVVNRIRSARRSPPRRAPNRPSVVPRRAAWQVR